MTQDTHVGRSMPTPVVPGMDGGSNKTHSKRALALDAV